MAIFESTGECTTCIMPPYTQLTTDKTCVGIIQGSMFAKEGGPHLKLNNALLRPGRSTALHHTHKTAPATRTALVPHSKTQYCPTDHDTNSTAHSVQHASYPEVQTPQPLDDVVVSAVCVQYCLPRHTLAKLLRIRTMLKLLSAPDYGTNHGPRDVPCSIPNKVPLCVHCIVALNADATG